MKTDILTSGSTVRNHISLKMVFECNVIRKTSYHSWFLVNQQILLQDLIHQLQGHFQDTKSTSTSMTTSRHEIDHPTTSSSSSTSIPTTLCSDGREEGTRERRRDGVVGERHERGVEVQGHVGGVSGRLILKSDGEWSIKAPKDDWADTMLESLFLKFQHAGKAKPWMKRAKLWRSSEFIRVLKSKEQVADGQGQVES